MVYAGDGENDAMAMKVVRKGDGLRGGKRGDRPLRGWSPARPPCREIRRLFGISRTQLAG
jgi:hypothetical protein